MNLPNDFTFSQSSLQDYTDCARRFELRYIKRLRYPTLEVQPDDVLEREQRVRQGIRFHKMAQQYLLGVPTDLLAKSLGDDDTLAEWWEAFIHSGLVGLPPQRYAEITLQTYLQGYRLIAKYDLLAIEPGGQAVIVDWKTSETMPPASSLRRQLQTAVYPYVLAQAGAYLYGEKIPPRNIRMVYCFVDRQGHRITFDYSLRQMQVDEAKLLQLIQDIQASQLFPLTEQVRRCRYCQFRSHCNRGDRAGDWHEVEFDDEPSDDEGFEIDFDQIAEIEF